MANKRNLKKEINFVCSELFAECIAVSTYTKLRNTTVFLLIPSIRISTMWLMRLEICSNKR